MLSIEDLFKEYTKTEFESKALDIFRFQAENNLVYKKFLTLLGTNINSISSIREIPFIPISFFKEFKVVSSDNPIEKTFSSSGTTGTSTSYHYLTDLSLYHLQLEASFNYFYGDFKNYIVFPLLPAYAERKGSSLIEMVDIWMQKTGQQNKAYYLYDHQQLAKDIMSMDKKIILIGVSFALMDFAEKYPLDLSNVIVMETGGMKGRRAELTRQELHNFLKTTFKTFHIHSEYGMTELLSQAYAHENGLFETPPWMKILLRDKEDPFSYVNKNMSGGINVIDFANINSCSFIATDDLGRLHHDNQLEILGRLDFSDLRGCNLLVVD